MARTFNDTKGRSWDLTLTVSGAKRVKALTDTDLLDAIDGKLLESLVGSPMLLVDVIYAIVKPQADKAGVTAEQFGEALAGNAIDEATSAFLEGLTDFFPPSRRRVLKMALEKTKALQERVVTKAAELLESDRLDKAVDAELAKLGDPADVLAGEMEKLRASGESSTSPPASSG